MHAITQMSMLIVKQKMNMVIHKAPRDDINFELLAFRSNQPNQIESIILILQISADHHTPFERHGKSHIQRFLAQSESYAFPPLQIRITLPEPEQKKTYWVRQIALFGER